MKKVLFIFFLFFALSVQGQGLDSLRREALAGKLGEYFGAIVQEPLAVQAAEADFMIEAASDSLVRQFVALWLYEHYIESSLMGAEGVAIHILDQWFLPGKVKMTSDMDFLNARIHADFNRMSLIGEKAPGLAMETNDGQFIELYTGPDKGGAYRVLYFYDTDCAKCRIESILLRNMLNTESFPIEFYAVYAGDDRTSWDTYIKEKLVVDSPGVKVTHLWDPTLESDFQRKYGVIQTPRLFLIAPDGTILGRGLDTKGLYAMLHGIFDQVELTYGSEESEELFDNVFALEERPSKDDVMYITEYINANTLERGDTVMFRQLTGDLMYYLASKTGEGYKEGLSDLLENQIFSRGDVWKSQDDSLKVTGYAEILSDLLSKAVPGTVVPDLKLPGVLMTSKKTKEGTFRLKKLRGSENVVIFYTVGCPVCDAEKAAARNLVQEDPKAKVLMVNVDSIVENDPVLADQLFKSFDLTSLPFILQTDKKGRILRRYISLQ